MILAFFLPNISAKMDGWTDELCVNEQDYAYFIGSLKTSSVHSKRLHEVNMYPYFTWGFGGIPKKIKPFKVYITSPFVR